MEKVPSQPQVKHAADTAERVPSPVEIKYSAISPASEDTPTSVPADLTASPSRPGSPVPSPSSTVQEEMSTVSTSSSTPRRRLRQRRVRRTPFDRAASEFVAIERNRLRFERERDARLHDMATERLRIEAQRVQLDRERVQVEAKRVRVEQVRAELRDSNQELNVQISALISLLETRDLRPN